MKKLRMTDLAREIDFLWDDILSTFQKVMKSSRFILGEEVKAFEQELAGFLNVSDAIGVSSGTDALIVALWALDIGPGDEVIVPTFTFAATAEAVLIRGARLVFCDVAEDANLDVNMLHDLINPETSAIIPVHLYGKPADMSYLLELRERYGIKIIEDCAQAFGARWDGKYVGTFGDVSAFSFFPAKVLGCFGDGGAVVTSSAELAARVRMIRNHGSLQKYDHRLIGGNFRLDEIQAAFLRVKLRHIEDFLSHRRRAFRKYIELFNRKGLGDLLLDYGNIEDHACNIFTIKLPKGVKRETLQKTLLKHGIESAVHYPLPLHLQPAFRFLGYQKGDFPVAEKLAESLISLPLHPFLSENEIEEVVEVVASCVG